MPPRKGRNNGGQLLFSNGGYLSKIFGGTTPPPSLASYASSRSGSFVSPFPSMVSDSGSGGNKSERLAELFNITEISWWWPAGWHEILIFVIAVIITYWIYTIYRFNQVESKVVTESRCYANNHALKSGNIQFVTATNARNAPLYKLSYNLASKQTNLDCACGSGTTINKFNNIPVYDLSTNRVSRTATLQCSCDTDLLSASPNIYYTGYPGLVKFMNTASISTNPNDDPNIDTSYFLTIPTN